VGRPVTALDRVLGRVHGYEQTWDRFGRDPRRLWRTPWEHRGRDLAQDLNRLAGVREFLQVARTLLHERVG
jgi:hypothetical protein